MEIKYLHTMVRVKDLEKSITFYNLLGLKEIKRNENDMGRFTLVFLAPDTTALYSSEFSVKS